MALEKPANPVRKSRVKGHKVPPGLAKAPGLAKKSPAGIPPGRVTGSVGSGKPANPVGGSRTPPLTRPSRPSGTSATPRLGSMPRPGSMEKYGGSRPHVIAPRGSLPVGSTPRTPKVPTRIKASESNPQQRPPGIVPKVPRSGLPSGKVMHASNAGRLQKPVKLSARSH